MLDYIYHMTLKLLKNCINFWHENLSNGLDSDQDRQNVCPDLGQNCLLRLSTDDKSRH